VRALGSGIRASRVGWAVLIAALMPAGIGVAAAQTAPVAPKPRRPLRLEIGASVVLVGSTDFGSAAANLTKPDGSNLALFQTSSTLGAGRGLEVNLGLSLTRSLRAEASAAWVVSELRSRISADFEDTAALTATETLSRVTVEGAATWTVFERGRTTVFARGSVGWMREIVGAGALYDDGVVASAGGGVKYWWLDRSRGRLRRLGVRADARVTGRSSSITLGNQSRRFSPVVAGGIVFGF
jgi:hypothetical protein